MSSCQEVRAAVLMREPGALESDATIADHVKGCPRCAEDVAAVRTATTATAELFDGWSPLSEPMALAETTMARATAWRERRSRQWRGRWVAVCAVAIAAWVVATSERTAPIRAALGFPDAPYTTTVLLQCVSPEAAAEVATPHLRSRGSEARAGSPGVPSVTLRGARDEVAQAEIAIALIDGKLGPPPMHCAR